MSELPAQSYRKKLPCIHIDDHVEIVVNQDRDYGAKLTLWVTRRGETVEVEFDAELARLLADAVEKCAHRALVIQESTYAG